MKIDLITMWYNEEFLAPFFLSHYAWVDRIHIILDADTSDTTEALARQYPNVSIQYFRFPDMMDDIIKAAVISQRYRQITDADYVIIVDSDEFIFPWDLNGTVREHLARTRRDAYFVNLWQIYEHETDQPLDPALPVWQQRVHGDPDMESPENIGYLKPIVVRGGLDTFWGIGNHYIVHQGVKLEWATRRQGLQLGLSLAIERDEMLQGAHWRLVNLEETIRRRITNRRERQSAVNLERGLTAHYHEITEADIVREFEMHRHDPPVIVNTAAPEPSAPAALARLELVRQRFVHGGELAGQGNYEAAAELYRSCLQIMPGLEDARLNLAWCLGAREDFAGAAAELEQLLRRNPQHDRARVLLGRSLHRCGRYAEAAHQFASLLRRAPTDTDALRGLAAARYQLQQYGQARSLAEQLLAVLPDDYDTLLTLASVERTENPERSLELYAALARLRPEDCGMRTARATQLLALGHFQEGWREFEQRIPTLKLSADILAIPRWHGQPLDGKVIVVVAEQGHGDVLQFIRFLPALAARGGRVMLLCHNDQIRPLAATMQGVSWAVIPREPLPALPDFHCPLMSLPHELGTTVATIPRSVPYLHPDPLKQSAWQQRLAALPGRKVGLVWAGNRAQADNGKRSVPFEKLVRLLDTADTSFVSLQVGPDALCHQPPLPEGCSIHDWSDELHDLSDTAALVSCLDLVISICSGVTHLCGALAVPAWVMLQYDADWRWLRTREDSPWYPTVRLFRQQRPGGWDELLQRVAAELAAWDGPALPIACAPAAELYSRGLERFTSGDPAAAEALFRQALERDDRSADALNGLATVLDQRGRQLEAAELYRRVLALEPDNRLALFNLANTLRRLDASGEAEALYRRAVAVAPDFGQAWGGLANLLLGADRLDEAEAALEQALRLQPHNPDLLCDRGILAGRLQDADGAEHWFRSAVDADSGHLAALNQLGMLLMRQNRLAEGEAVLRQALAVKPDYWLALNNLGVLLHWAGRLEEAEACHRRFIAARPDNGTPHYNLALVLLSRGRFAEGWQEYEWRFRKDDPVPLRYSGIPRWQGDAPAGRTVLVHAEQGYGDTIQFARYLPLLAGRGARIVLECQDRIIAPLFSGMPGLGQVVARGDDLPPLDQQVPLMSLPSLLGEAACHEPVAVNYLTADPVRAALWRERLSALPGRLVGLVWSGRRGQENNHNRMIPPELFARLGGMAGVSFVNLLVGIDDPEADAALECLNRYDARPYLRDFADTAALLSCLDLLISVDTATAHLAGALGKEAWVMIPYNADWRWSFGLPDCPLYPSVRLYRQEAPFAWEPVLQAVRTDLQHRLTGSAGAVQDFLQAARSARDAFRWQEAREAFRQHLEREPDNLEALSGVGACLQMLNNSAEAIDWYDRALRLYPTDAALHCNRALALLTAGRYAEGWQEFQWRKASVTETLPPIPLLTPEGMRADLAGKSLLLHAEQGFGDTIQMLRYAAPLAARGVRVVASVPLPLARLAACMHGVAQVVPHGELLPSTDFQALTLDLPWLAGSTPETVPAGIPYITLPEALLAQWHERLAAFAPPRVGLVWACGGENRLNRELRSLPFSWFQPLLQKQIRFFSLQIGPAALTAADLAAWDNLHDLTGLIADFADTAALIQQLDHVVTVDSAVAHLAGALGKPVSLLLPAFREWRWVERDERALWYPTVQIFTQDDSMRVGNEIVRALVAAG